MELITAKRKAQWDRFQQRILSDSAYIQKIRLRMDGKIDKDGEYGDCWEWRKERSESGYGLIRFNGASAFRAHRVAYLVYKEESIDADICILHHCDHPPCCNPLHLFKGSRGDNARDRKQKGRSRYGDRVGIANPAAKLSEEDVRYVLDHFIPRIKSGPNCLSSIASRFHVTRPTIQRIINGQGWSKFGGSSTLPPNFLTEEQQREIFDRYEGGNNHGPNCRSALAKEFNVQGYTINNVMKKFRSL